MIAKDFFKKICIHTCFYFTAATLLLILFGLAVNQDLSRGIHPGAQALLLPFSFLLATANIQFKYADFHIAGRTAIHYALTMFGTMCCLYLPNKNAGAGGSQGLILFVALSAIYAIIMGIVLGIRARIKRVTRDESRYKSVYKQDRDEPEPVKRDHKKKDEYQSGFKKK